jgi:hypothetical protein
LAADAPPLPLAGFHAPLRVRLGSEVLQPWHAIRSGARQTFGGKGDGH